MGIALFLDVDNTLTKGFIQRGFAEILECAPEYDEIELEFQEARLDAAGFGDRLIELFNAKGFSEDFAREHYPDIELQPWTNRLLGLPVNRYLVSSGPNYYIEPLARDHAIDKDKVICSQYRFATDGSLGGCDAIDTAQKAAFVSRVVDQYDLSVGIGDDIGKDGPFLTSCVLPILTQVPAGGLPAGYLHATSISTVHTFIDKLGFNESPCPRPRVFIGSASGAKKICQAIQSNLDEVAEPTVWNQGIFKASSTTIESLEAALEEVDFAVLVLTPEDLLEKKRKLVPAVRDNVIFELGLFTGKLGRERCLMVRPRNVELDLPSDLDAVTTLSFDADRVNSDWRAALGPASTEIAERIERLGFL